MKTKGNDHIMINKQKHKMLDVSDVNLVRQVWGQVSKTKLFSRSKNNPNHKLG